VSDFGIISSCWRVQLESGVFLDELLAEAERRGYRHVELRQGCLAAYETAGEGGACPGADALRRLPDRFPRLRFNLAMALPYLGGEVAPESPLFEAGLRGAIALDGAGTAHLRLVDTETRGGALDQARENALATRLAALASACRGHGAILSVENGRQPWEALRRIFSGARERLAAGANALLLCYDPSNLHHAADRPDPQEVTAQLRGEEIGLLHFKQSQSGAQLPVIGPGEIDWAEQLAVLRRKAYAGPQLFEIPAGPDIWERLDQSRRYVSELEAER
jgi:sugar phosphate isomerase/epimerase